MSDQDIATLKGAYDDFNNGNPQAVLALLTDDIEWVEPGGGKSPEGTFNSAEAVGNDVFAAIPQQFEDYAVTPEDFDDQGDKIVVTGSFTGRSKDGVDLDAPFIHTFEMRDGKVAKFENKAGGNWAEAWGG